MNKFRPIKAVAAFHCHCDGIALIWTAIFLLLFILLAGLVIDTAKVYLVSHQLQNAADAAALAGARWVKEPNDRARDQAKFIAGQNSAEGTPVILDWNYANNSNGDIIIGYFDKTARTFTPLPQTDPNVNALKVVTKRISENSNAVSLIFGPIVNVNTANVVRSATAVVEFAGDGLITLCGICTNCDKPGLIFNDTSDTLIVNNGNIQVNSSVPPKGNIDPTVIANEIDIVSNATPPAFLPNTVTQTGQPCLPDPLGSIMPPYWNPLNDLSPTDKKGNRVPLTSQSQYKGPGYYSAGIDGAGLNNLILDSGIYVLGGAGGTTDNPNGLKGSFTANNVMLYLTGTGAVNLQGSEKITLTPMTSGEYKDIAIYQDRADSSTPKNGINGGEGVNIKGTIYLPAVDLLLTGTPSKGNGTFGNQIIVNTLQIKGNVTIDVTYTGAYQIYASYLVE